MSNVAVKVLELIEESEQTNQSAVYSCKDSSEVKLVVEALMCDDHYMDHCDLGDGNTDVWSDDGSWRILVKDKAKIESYWHAEHLASYGDIL